MSDPSATRQLFEQGLLKESPDTVVAALGAGLPINDLFRHSASGPWDWTGR